MRCRIEGGEVSGREDDKEEYQGTYQVARSARGRE